MDYELVNVTGMRDSAFTAELIVSDDFGWNVVGVYEDSNEGNFVGGVSLYTVHASQIEQTGETIFRQAGGEDVVYTPQLV